jgi:hypothetical protein
MVETVKKFSTTQVASVIGTLLTLYNLWRTSQGMEAVTLTGEQVLALATAALPILSFLWVMKERVKKSTLKWGILKVD